MTNGSHKALSWPEKGLSWETDSAIFYSSVRISRVSINAPTFRRHTSCDDELMICHRLCHHTNATNLQLWLEFVVGLVWDKRSLCPDLYCQECVKFIHLGHRPHIVLSSTNFSLEASGLRADETSAVSCESSLHLSSGALPAICVHAALSQLQLLPHCQIMTTFLMCLANAPSHTLGYLASLARNPRTITFGPLSPFLRYWGPFLSIWNSFMNFEWV